MPNFTISATRADKLFYSAYLEPQKNTEKLSTEFKNVRISANPKTSIANESIYTK